MGWLRRLWTRIKEDWRDLLALLAGEPDEPVDMTGVVPEPPDQHVDWFVWECEQYAKSPVFWFDHWRYVGTPWAYPEPTEPERRKVWNSSLKRAIAAFGEDAVRAQGNRLAAEIVGTPREDEYYHQPDPWAWAMSQAVH